MWPVATALDGKHYRTFPSAQELLWDRAALETLRRREHTLSCPALSTLRLEALLDRLPRETGETVRADHLHSTVQEENIRFSDRTDISHGRSCQLMGIVGTWGRKHMRACACVSPCHACPHISACTLFMECWGRGPALNELQGPISLKNVFYSICDLFLIFSRKEGALVSSVLVHLIGLKYLQNSFVTLEEKHTYKTLRSFSSIQMESLSPPGFSFSSQRP